MTNQSTEQSEFSLSCVLEKLRRWRHFPAYQLERRVDILFSFVLPKVVQREFERSETDNWYVVPEFPLHKGIVFDAKKNKNQSIKVDFAVFSKSDKQIFLVELKTDNSSIKKKQLKHMEEAKKAGVSKLLKGVIKCARHSDGRGQRKYFHLICELENIGCIHVPKKFDQLDVSAEKPGLNKALKELCKRSSLKTVVSNSWKDTPVELVLLFPGKKLKGLPSKVKEFLQVSSLYEVSISKIADIVEEKHFKDFLLDISASDAGRTCPRSFGV